MNAQFLAVAVEQVLFLAVAQIQVCCVDVACIYASINDVAITTGLELATELSRRVFGHEAKPLIVYLFPDSTLHV